MVQPIGASGGGITELLRALQSADQEKATALAKIATGDAIFQAAENPAGLITSENLRAVLAELDAEVRTLERTDAVVSTADAALGEVSSLLSEAEALAVANAGGGLSDEEIVAALSFIKSRWPEDMQRQHDLINDFYARTEGRS